MLPQAKVHNYALFYTIQDRLYYIRYIQRDTKNSAIFCSVLHHFVTMTTPEQIKNFFMISIKIRHEPNTSVATECENGHFIVSFNANDN